MGTTSKGAMIGGAIDAMNGDDSAVDGALIGGTIAFTLKYVVVPAAALGLGWYAWRRLRREVDEALHGDSATPAA